MKFFLGHVQIIIYLRRFAPATSPRLSKSSIDDAGTSSRHVEEKANGDPPKM